MGWYDAVYLGLYDTNGLLHTGLKTKKIAINLKKIHDKDEWNVSQLHRKFQ